MSKHLNTEHAENHIALPGWLVELQRKHQLLMHNHQIRFGKLGQLQTKKQKLSLQNTLKREQS